MGYQNSTFESPVDGTSLATYLFDPPLAEDATQRADDTARPPAGTAQPRAVVQIAHGVAEHAGRYDRVASALGKAGFLVRAIDHRGHGRSITSTPGDFGPAGFDGLVRDVAAYGQHLRTEHPGVPVFLLGHSMGSFAAQVVMLDHSEQYAGVVLSGSSALDVLAAGMAESAEPAGLEAFNAGFEHRTGYEWLSRDEAEVDAYVADPLCGFDVPEQSMAGMMTPGARLADPAALAGIRSDLPVLIASGSDDPLSGGGELVQLLGQRYRDAGLTDVTVTVYPGARHEILNETNRDEVTRDVTDWLERHC